VIPNKVDAMRFHPCERRVEPRPLVEIGTHGRIKPIKGPDMLLEAMAGLGDGRHRLRLAGPVNDAFGADLRERYHRPGAVEFVGEPDAIPEFLRSLDLYVLPSRSEGMSMALLEAMATGLPIVATDVGSNRAVLADGEAGLVVAPDPPAIAAGIDRLLRDPALAARLGRAARRRVEAEFSLDRMVRRFEDFYAGLVPEAAS
jgi:glycosyltransferase involved in cell wall biosynthesis